MLVFAFDRDWTVDVNPHPERAAVPLKWVRHLAHETEHAVYATGNQTLADEAEIPGVVDAVGMHPDDPADWLGEQLPDGRYETFPTRRERLALVADLHPCADGYVVVDDLDLSDVDGWDHYRAWEFVSAVERGEIHPSLPWVETTADDGRRPTDRPRSSGLSPVDASRLESFLDEYEGASAFDLTYLDDGEQRARTLLWVEQAGRSFDRPAARPTVRCVPLDPDGEPFTVAVDDVRTLSTVELGPGLPADADASPAEVATMLAHVARHDPDAASVSRLLSLIQLERDAARPQVLSALRSVAEARPGDCTPAVPTLRSLLAAGELEEPGDALAALAAIGDRDAADVAPLVGVVVPYLTGTDERARKNAARCLGVVAAADPADAVDAVPGLETIVADRSDGLAHAVYALDSVSEEYPAAVKPVADTLGDAIVDPSLSTGVRSNATAALGRVAGEYPDVAVDLVDAVVALFDADDPGLRNNAIGLVGDVGTVHGDVVEPHADAIASLLTVDDAFTRTNASAALARVAADFPGSVDAETETFVDLLTDDEPVVRENACWALGHLEAESAREALRERVEADEDADVLTRAQWALAQLERQ